MHTRSRPRVESRAPHPPKQPPNSEPAPETEQQRARPPLCNQLGPPQSPGQGANEYGTSQPRRAPSAQERSSVRRGGAKSSPGQCVVPSAGVGRHSRGREGQARAETQTIARDTAGAARTQAEPPQATDCSRCEPRRPPSHSTDKAEPSLPEGRPPAGAQIPWLRIWIRALAGPQVASKAGAVRLPRGSACQAVRADSPPPLSLASCWLAPECRWRP
jgi:hypothetical protein